MNSLMNGVKVLDFSSYVAGPTTTMLMAYMGADVVKVEMPVCGDSGRGMLNLKIGHHSSNMLQVNHGRKSIECDISDPEGQALIKKLIPEYDVVLEGFRPGQMKKYGLDYESLKEIKPDLIYCSISAYGQTGPYSKRPGFDLIAQAESGIISSTGDPNGPPQRVGTYLGDVVAAQVALANISASLFNRERTGKGQYLDVSLYEALAYISSNIDPYFLLGLKIRRTGNHTMNSAPYGLFEGNGGRYIAICAPAPKTWEALCKAMKREDLLANPEYINMAKRIENRLQLADVIQEWLSGFDNVDEAVKILQAAGVPCAKVREDWEMSECPQLNARRYFETVPFPESIREETGRETYQVRGLPCKTSSDCVNENYLPIPDVGEHNYDIYDSVISREELDPILARWHKTFKPY